MNETIERDYKAEIRRQAASVAARRNIVARRKAFLDKLRAEWEQDNAANIDELRVHEDLLKTEEGILRALALEAYGATGDKRPGAGVAIRSIRKLVYDRIKALQWAREQAPIFLTLDVKPFESYVKDDPPDFVTVFEEPQATIATDLEKALADATPA